MPQTSTDGLLGISLFSKHSSETFLVFSPRRLFPAPTTGRIQNLMLALRGRGLPQLQCSVPFWLQLSDPQEPELCSPPKLGTNLSGNGSPSQEHPSHASEPRSKFSHLKFMAKEVQLFCLEWWSPVSNNKDKNSDPKETLNYGMWTGSTPTEESR